MGLAFKSRAMSRLASAILCLFAAAVVGARLPVIGLVFAAAALVFGYLAYREFRPNSDPYDLNLLREIHEEEELRNVRVPDDVEGNIICPICGEVYGNDLPMCPSCGRTGN